MCAQGTRAPDAFFGRSRIRVVFLAPFFGPWNAIWRAVPQFAWRHRTRSRAGMPPKIKLVAKSDAEIALERKYELLRKQRAGVAAGPAPPGAKRVGDPGRTAAVASSFAAGSGPSKDAPGGGDQKPMTAKDFAKMKHVEFKKHLAISRDGVDGSTPLACRRGLLPKTMGSGRQRTIIDRSKCKTGAEMRRGRPALRGRRRAA